MNENYKIAGGYKSQGIEAGNFLKTTEKTGIYGFIPVEDCEVTNIVYADGEARTNDYSHCWAGHFQSFEAEVISCTFSTNVTMYF